MNRQSRTKIIIVSVGILLLLLSFVWWDNHWVMKINGQKISEDEYVFYQKLYPRLDKKGLETQIVEEKVQLQQAKKQKFDVVDNYKTLVKKTKEINQKNQKKSIEKQVIYGLKKYDEQTYYAYTLRNSINELKKIYQKDITDKNIKTFYETYLEGFREVENKDLYRVEGDKNTLQNLISANSREERIEAAEAITFEKVQLTESNMRDWLKYYDEEIYDVIPQPAGTWSAIYGNGNKKRCYYCIRTKKGPIQPIEKVSESIRIQLEKENYREYVKKWVKEAKVVRKNRRHQ